MELDLLVLKIGCLCELHLSVYRDGIVGKDASCVGDGQLEDGHTDSFTSPDRFLFCLQEDF